MNLWPAKASRSDSGRRMTCPACASDRFTVLGYETSVLCHGQGPVELKPTRAMLCCASCYLEVSIRLDEPGAAFVESKRPQKGVEMGGETPSAEAATMEMRRALDDLMGRGPDAVAEWARKSPAGRLVDGRSG